MNSDFSTPLHNCTVSTMLFLLLHRSPFKPLPSNKGTTYSISKDQGVDCYNDQIRQQPAIELLSPEVNFTSYVYNKFNSYSFERQRLHDNLVKYFKIELVKEGCLGACNIYPSDNHDWCSTHNRCSAIKGIWFGV